MWKDSKLPTCQPVVCHTCFFDVCAVLCRLRYTSSKKLSNNRLLLRLWFSWNRHSKKTSNTWLKCFYRRLLHTDTCIADSQMLTPVNTAPQTLTPVSETDPHRHLCSSFQHTWRTDTHCSEHALPSMCRLPLTVTCVVHNNNNNNNRIERRNSRFFTISSLRCEPSPTRTLKWLGRNHVQITCNLSCYMPCGTKGQLSY